MYKTQIEKTPWQIECDVSSPHKVMSVQIGFSHEKNEFDETEFSISAYDKVELAHLFQDFCEENGFENVSINCLAVVRVAPTMEELIEMESHVNTTWPYGENFFNESPELFNRWSDDLEIGLKVADIYFDYLWDISVTGEIILTDCLLGEGVTDSLSKEREASNSLVLRFKDVRELFAYFLPQMKNIVGKIENPEFTAAVDYIENRMSDTLHKRLDSQIDSASTRVVVAQNTSQRKTKEPEPEI